MHFLGVNVWTVLVAAVATMVVGFLWYSPALFAKPWMKLMGYDPHDKEEDCGDAQERRAFLFHVADCEHSGGLCAREIDRGVWLLNRG